MTVLSGSVEIGIPRNSRTWGEQRNNPFDRILEDNKYKSIQQKNIESLAIEIYKFHAGLTPPIMSDLFAIRENNYNLRNF